MTFLWPFRCQLSVRLWGPREDERAEERVHGKGTSTLTSRLVRGCQTIMNKGGNIKKREKKRCEEAKRLERHKGMLIKNPDNVKGCWEQNTSAVLTLYCTLCTAYYLKNSMQK